MSWEAHIESMDRAVQEHLGGVAVHYAPENRAAVDVVGVFDENYRLAEDGAEDGVERRVPAVFLRLADLPIHPDDDNPLITIAGTAYTVRERRTDGAAGGSVLLLLERA